MVIGVLPIVFAPAFHLRRCTGKALSFLQFERYNFARLHKSERVIPAMAAGVSDRLWALEELVE
jgi:hypothetical protein